MWSLSKRVYAMKRDAWRHVTVERNSAILFEVWFNLTSFVRNFSLFANERTEESKNARNNSQFFVCYRERFSQFPSNIPENRTPHPVIRAKSIQDSKRRTPIGERSEKKFFNTPICRFVRHLYLTCRLVFFPPSSSRSPVCMCVCVGLLRLLIRLTIVVLTENSTI